MVLKTKNGDFVEFTSHDYHHFVAELMVEFQKEEKLNIYFQKDTRVEAANLLLNTVAQQGRGMDEELKNNYLKTAYELLEKYNSDNPDTSNVKINTKKQ